MKLRDIQAFIPGWNIVYFICEYREGNRRIREMENAHSALEREMERDLELTDVYAHERELAKANGDLEGAKSLDRKIAEMAIKYINRIGKQ